MKPRKDKFIRREEVTATIKLLAEQYPYFGYCKIYAILKYKEGITVRRNTVYRVMKESKILLPPTRCNKKFFKGTKLYAFFFIFCHSAFGGSGGERGLSPILSQPLGRNNISLNFTESQATRPTHSDSLRLIRI